MTPERFAELDANGGTLTPAEQALGWHFCHEFDGLLTMGEGPGPCPCGIHGDSPLQLTRDPEPHGSRDTFVPPPVKSDIELLREKLISMDAITEIDLGGCPPNEQQLSDITVSTNPPIVHQHNDQWYFWEETYSQRIGPYSTEIAANKALDHYCDVVLGQGKDPT